MLFSPPVQPPYPDVALELAVDALSCEIRASTSPDSVRLDAVASSPWTVTGSYSFSILKQSGSGSSETFQSGDFSLKSGKVASCFECCFRSLGCRVITGRNFYFGQIEDYVHA